MKRILALCLVMLFCLSVPTTAFAYSESDEVMSQKYKQFMEYVKQQIRLGYVKEDFSLSEAEYKKLRTHFISELVSYGLDSHIYSAGDYADDIFEIWLMDNPYSQSKINAANAAAAAQEAVEFAQRPISLVVNGKTVKTTTPPQVVGGRTLVPLRAFAEGINCQAVWMDETKTIIIATQAGEPIMSMTIGDKTAYLPNSDTPERFMDVAPQIINGSTMVPARFIAEALGYVVVWDEKTKTVTMNMVAG